LELLNGAIAGFNAVELDYANTSGTTGGLKPDLGTFDFTDGGKQFDQVLITGRPRQL
jgi:hypothetical protein